jgi:hypothetical protein
MKITFKVLRRRTCCISTEAHTCAGPEAEQVRHRGRAFGNGTQRHHAIAVAVAVHCSVLMDHQIGELKAKIQSDKGWEVPQQKLIYSGKLVSAQLASDIPSATGADSNYRQDPPGCQHY